jgi:hypothetical protein
MPHGVGVRYQPATPRAMMARLLAADKPGGHVWVMVAAWLMANPASADNPDAGNLLDAENLVQFQGPGCFKCERPYSPKLAAQRCRGKL